MHAKLCLAQQLCSDVHVFGLVVVLFLLRALLSTLHQVHGKVFWWDPSDWISSTPHPPFCFGGQAKYPRFETPPCSANWPKKGFLKKVKKRSF